MVAIGRRSDAVQIDTRDGPLFRWCGRSPGTSRRPEGEEESPVLGGQKHRPLETRRDGPQVTVVHSPAETEDQAGVGVGLSPHAVVAEAVGRGHAGGNATPQRISENRCPVRPEVHPTSARPSADTRQLEAVMRIAAEHLAFDG